MRFDGYNHTVSCSEGQIWTERNMSDRAWPYMRPRRDRERETITATNGIFAASALGWIHGPNLFYDGHLVGYVEDSPKQIAVMGGRVVIWPDKVVLNAKYKRLGVYASLETLRNQVKNPKEFDAYGVGSAVPYELYAWNGTEWVSYGKELEPLEAVKNIGTVQFANGTYKGAEAEANTMKCGYNVAEYGFKVGDAVTITGCTKHPENNKTAIIREITSGEIRFYAYAFKLDGKKGNQPYYEPGNITIARKVPDLDVICAVHNRLWGARGDSLYASKLGDPSNFNVFDGLSTDSWYQETGTPGDFTGGIGYRGLPIFFKERVVCKIYGENAENFVPSLSATLGVREGSQKSLAIAGEVLYYLSPNGLCAYSGGVPENVSEPFGQVQYTEAVAGSDGQRLYLAMTDTAGQREVFCLDSATGILHREDEERVEQFACFDGVLYGMTGTGPVYRFNQDNQKQCPDSMVELGNLYDQSMDKKQVQRLQMRVRLEAGATLRVLIQYDSDGIWHPVKTLGPTRTQSLEFPVRVHRCDHYRIKFEGSGYYEILSMSKQFWIGSGIK